MISLIDLHTHSYLSDGSYSPRQLVKEAFSSGLKAIALTDHDTVDGIDEAIEAGNHFGIEMVSGIEFSVKTETTGTCHMLGLLIDHRHPAITKPLQNITDGRNERNRKIISRLNETGLFLTSEEVEAISQTGQTGRPHIGQVLVNKGYVKSLNQSMEKYLGKGRTAYFDRYKLDIIEAIEVIHQAGGLAILAHPIYLEWPVPVLDSKIGYLKDNGLDGLEIYYPAHNSSFVFTLENIAAKYDLLVSGGSDFHGSYKPDIKLGYGQGNLRVRYDLLQCMKEKVCCR